MATAQLIPLPPEDAIRVLLARGRQLSPTFAWQDAYAADHAAAFTVAKSAGFDVLQDIFNGLSKALQEGRTLREVRARLDLAPDALAALEERFGARLPFGAPVPGTPLTLHCPDKAVFALVEHLDGQGADDVTVSAPTYVFRRANRLLERLNARI